MVHLCGYFGLHTRYPLKLKKFTNESLLGAVIHSLDTAYSQLIQDKSRFQPVKLVPCNL